MGWNAAQDCADLGWCSWRYCDGVCPVCFLKIVLKAVLELKPASNAMASKVKFCFFGSAKSFLTASTRYWLMKSKKFVNM